MLSSYRRAVGALVFLCGSAFCVSVWPQSILVDHGSPDFHAVVWTDVFLPGAGEMILGDNKLALGQLVGEVGSFTIGYNMSDYHPMTLDGVPESNPYQAPSFSRELNADVWQELGLKSHMVSVFDTYRKAGARGGQGIDDSSLPDLFLAPFKWANVSDPWVYGALACALAYHVYTYSTESVVYGVPLSPSTNQEYAALYAGVYPLGGGAPEEMFYRGFLQNEMLLAFGSPYWAVPLSSATYMLSHAPNDRLGAGVSGLYLGTLTYQEDGRLSKGIAFHFWSDVISGVHAIASLTRQQKVGDRAPALFHVDWEY